MAAANTDKFTKGARRFSTTLGAGGISDASTTSATLTSTTGLPTDTAVYLVIDRVDSDGNLTPSKEEVVKGVISGSTITSMLRGVEGTAQAHSAGAVVEVKLVADQFGDMIDGILAEHAQDGTHGDITASSATVSGNTTISGTTTISSKRIGTVNAIGNSGATKTIDLTDGETQSITITANTTLTLTNFAAGDYLTLFMDMDGTGGYTVDIAGSGVTFYSDGTTLNTDASARNVVGIRFVSATEARVFVNAGLTSITALT